MNVFDRPVERWNEPPTPRHLRDGIVAVSIAVMLHVTVLVSVGGFDGLQRSPRTSAEEIPVDLVDKIPDQPAIPPATTETAAQSRPEDVTAASGKTAEAQEQKPADPSVKAAAETDVSKPDLAEAQPRQQSPATPISQEPAQAAMRPPDQPRDSPSPQSQTPPAPAAPALQPFPRQAQPAQGSPVLVPAEKSEGEPPDGPREPPPPPSGPETAAEKEPALPSEHDAATAEFRFVPQGFRFAAAPAADQSTDANYKGLVFSLIRQSQRFPPAAEARGATGTAVVSFMLDRAGNVVTLTLVKPTGDRDLDAEAIALVRRAAPFPKPPPGVLLTFAPLIVFALGPPPEEH